MLLDEEEKLHHRFGLDCDPALPVQTLLVRFAIIVGTDAKKTGCIILSATGFISVYSVQAADFLGCKSVQKDIMQHLQTALTDIIDQSEILEAPDTSDTLLSLVVHRTYCRDLHNLQVSFNLHIDAQPYHV